jgi:hypothetical protein
MTLEITVYFQPDGVIIQEVGSNFRTTIGNVITIENPSKRVVEIGKYATDFERDYPRFWQARKAQLSFLKIFDPEDFDLPAFLIALRMMIFRTRNTKYPKFVEHFSHWNDNISLELSLAGYDRLDIKTRNRIELTLPGYLKTKTLAINGSIVETYYSQRRLVKSTVPLFVALGLVTLSAITILLMLCGQLSDPIDSFAGILLLMTVLLVIGCAGGSIGLLAWAIVFQKLIPDKLFYHLAVDQKLLPGFIMRILKIDTYQNF